MKPNPTYAKQRAGMTLLELTVSILVILALVTMLFIGARAWKRGSDRAANLINIRNCQQAMRGQQNMRQLNSGATFTQTELLTYTQYPDPVNSTVGIYSNTGQITPESSNPASTWDHIWLIPGGAGLPDDFGGAGYGHESIVETTGW